MCVCVCVWGCVYIYSQIYLQNQFVKADIHRMRMVMSIWWNSKTHPHASICLQTDKELHKYTEELLVDLSWINWPLSPFDIICQLETTNLCCLVDNLLGKMTTIYEITRSIKYSANCLSPLAIHLVEMKTKTTQHEILWPLGEILISLCFGGLFSTLSHECSESFYCLLTCLLLLSDNRQHCQRRSWGQ